MGVRPLEPRRHIGQVNNSKVRKEEVNTTNLDVDSELESGKKNALEKKILVGREVKESALDKRDPYWPRGKIKTPGFLVGREVKKTPWKRNSLLAAR